MVENTVYFPEAFLAQMHVAMPTHLSFDDFITACQRPLRRSIRVNTLEISVADFLSLVVPYGWQLAPVPWCEEEFWTRRDGDDVLPLGSTAEHLNGLLYIQEASSTLPVAVLFVDNPQPERIMDIVAAPGSKTTQIAARTGNVGGIPANEFFASRVKVLHASISHRGIGNIALTHFDDRAFGTALPEAFDVILLGTPCSDGGVARKNADALKNWSPEGNLDIAATQRKLIDSAFHALRPGGTLVYSTCILNREENQSVVQWLLPCYPQAVETLPLRDLFPGTADALAAGGFLYIFSQIYDCEGFFTACLCRTVVIDPLPAPSYEVSKLPFTPLKSRGAAAVTAVASAVGLVWDVGHAPWQRDEELRLFPQVTGPLFGQVRLSRIGACLIEVHNKGYRWQYEAVIAFVTSQRVSELTQEEMEGWYRGCDAYPQTAPQQDEAIVASQGVPLGLAKRVGSRLKNSYSRELVRDGKLFTSKV